VHDQIVGIHAVGIVAVGIPWGVGQGHGDGRPVHLGQPGRGLQVLGSSAYLLDLRGDVLLSGGIDHGLQIGGPVLGGPDPGFGAADQLGQIHRTIPDVLAVREGARGTQQQSARETDQDGGDAPAPTAWPANRTRVHLVLPTRPGKRSAQERAEASLPTP